MSILEETTVFGTVFGLNQGGGGLKGNFRRAEGIFSPGEEGLTLEKRSGFLFGKVSPGAILHGRRDFSE